MTWNPSKPANNENPKLAPAQIRQNWQRLESIITPDHQFNFTAQNTDGYHKRISWIRQASLPSIPTDANGISYLLTVDLGTGVNRDEAFTKVTDSNCFHGMRAYVNFQGSAVNTATCTINSAFNVSSVERTAQGEYVVKFSLPIKTINYCVSGSAISQTIQTTVTLKSGATLAASQFTTHVLINIRNLVGQIDPVAASILVFGG